MEANKKMTESSANEEEFMQVEYDENVDVVTVRLIENPEGPVVMREDPNHDCILYAIDEKNGCLVGVQIYSFKALRRSLVMQHLWKNLILFSMDGIKRWVYELIKVYKEDHGAGSESQKILGHA